MVLGSPSVAVAATSPCTSAASVWGSAEGHLHVTIEAMPVSSDSYRSKLAQASVI